MTKPIRGAALAIMLAGLVAVVASTATARFAQNAPKNNWIATTAPTVDDDVSLGFSAGSVWIDTSGTGVYTLTDGTDGAASWAQTNSTELIAGAVDLSEMADLAQDTIIGRATASTGAPEAMTAAQVYSMISGETGDPLVVQSHVGTGPMTVITGTYQTTAAGTEAAQALTLTDGKVYWLVADVIARQSDGSQRAWYRKAALFYRQGGDATQEGGSYNIGTIESAGAWDIGFNALSGDARLVVAGAADTTIDWQFTLSYQSMP